jgi:hypothetical protein
MIATCSTDQREQTLLRAGRTKRVSGSGCRFSLSERGRGDWNSRMRVSKLNSIARQEAIASGEMYPECSKVVVAIRVAATADAFARTWTSNVIRSR